MLKLIFALFLALATPIAASAYTLVYQIQINQCPHLPIRSDNFELLASIIGYEEGKISDDDLIKEAVRHGVPEDNVRCWINACKGAPA